MPLLPLKKLNPSPLSKRPFRLLDGKQRKQVVDYLIKAQIPRNNEGQSASLLYHNILQNVLGRKFINANGGEYLTCCLDIDSKGRMVGGDGKCRKVFPYTAPLQKA